MNNSPKLNIDRQVRLRFGMTKRNKLARAARQKPMASGAALSHRSATPLPVAVLRNEMTCDRLSPLTLFRKGPPPMLSNFGSDPRSRETSVALFKHLYRLPIA
jgi:hypothetical protein